MIQQPVERRNGGGGIEAAASDETAPIASHRSRGASSMFRSFGSLFGENSNNVGSMGIHSPTNAAEHGYVEFGMQDPDRSGRTLGTFAGVFSPVALSMFSALIFIRVGFIVGNAGLYVTLLQFVIAYLILLFTVASVCAISTNGAVEGGGVYFMISRTLGLEFGGSIGTLFFLANVVGCAMAISGCTEGMMVNFGPGGYFTKGDSGLLPDGTWCRFLFSTIINTSMLVVCLIGAALFAKTSVLILGTVTICLLATYISFLAEGEKVIDRPKENEIFNATTKLNYTGLKTETLMENLYPHYVRDYTSDGKMVDFATTFGVLFAGVTGIMAGANMSGELKSPSRSIPTGTLSAVAFTFVSYILLSFLMAFTTPAVTMQNNYLFLMPVNFWPPFTAIGILTATFSTGLSNLIGSSRILEALSKDQVFGSLLNFVLRGTWKGNPVAAVFTSWLLVECILLIGSLNAIAQVNSVLFMLSYLATNLACLGIELTGAPNFRPLFKYFTWHTCLIGLLGTLIMMFVINPIYASSSIILCLILVIALHLFSPASQGTQWGSISQALMFHQVRKYLLMLDSRKDHVKFWRPQMLLLVSSPRSCCPLVDFVNDMKKGGLYVIGHVKVGDYTAVVDPTIEDNKYWLSFLDHMKVKAFAEVTLAQSIREGVQHLIRLSGIGAMKPNTIILGFYDSEVPKDFFEAGTSPYKTDGFNHGEIQNFPIRRDGEEKQIDVAEYVAIMCDVLRMKKNLCLCRHFHRLDKNFIAKSKHLRYIDVWPINVFNPNSNNPFDVVSLFMMQLAVIINMLAKWKHLRLRVFLCESNNAQTNVSSFDTQMPQMDIFARMKLEQSLKNLRIEADIIEIQEWSSESDFTTHSRILKQFTSHADEDNEVITEENLNRSKLYMQRANQIIRERSDQTAVSFIYLAAPPQIAAPDFNERSARYIELLTELTAELPPTILVHGVNTVTSTTL
ncbi:solute carrier family 12 member 9 [Ceratitis capitata]|uniref:solute carrier family 12 member 9 n=1 Tax=Ceratitis capitata TaxID=7213 RepID=UPI00032A1E0B|nr:solute carrier family 12 member 9 [Ceratitis capitata]XP_004521822.1 solute carrier family 12 member 9 [Ceratitis capitata]